ncbi:MAG: gliding motility-associated C-terminal domain-containing protein [Bacteroidetes bacterium]|nr:gliding motility-associated C-terminal domain-containing protein [Bacteroidota bacterium]
MNKILLVLFSVLVFKVHATRWYVDDASNIGDVFTSASIAGNDANPGTFAQPFATVPFALSMAAPFDTICVDAGTYAQLTIINKNIHIFGAGNTLTIFDNSNKSLTGGSAFSINTNRWVDIRSMMIRNYRYAIFHPSGSPADSCRAYFDSLDINNNFTHGIDFEGSTKLRILKVKNSIFYDNNGIVSSRGLLSMGPAIDTAIVQNSIFNNNSLVALDFNFPNLATAKNKFAAVQNSTLTSTGGPGIALGGFQGGLVENNVLRDNQYASIELKTCSGTGSISGINSFVVSKNDISITSPSIQRRDITGIAIINRDQNVAGGSGTLTSQGLVVVENEISNYRVQNTVVTAPPTEVVAWAAAPYNSEVPDTLFDAFGIVVEGNNHKIVRNKFTNCEIGLHIQELPAFSGATAPISDYFDANRCFVFPTGTITAQKNGFFACKRAAQAVNITNSIDLGNSFLMFNTISSFTNVVLSLNPSPIAAFPVINPHFTLINPLKPTGKFDFSPWLKNNTDGATIGFQGDLSYLVVNETSPISNGLLYVQEAHDTVSGAPNLKVEIENAHYNERNVVSKNVHYIGVTSPTINTISMQGLSDTLWVDAGFEIKDSLICNQGVINTSSLNTILLKETAISDLGTTTSFVNGPLKAERASTGSFTLNLPVGKQTFGNRNVKLELNQTTNTLTTYTVEYFSVGAPTLSINSPITNTWIPQSHWLINDANSNNFTNPKITLNYNTNDYPISNAHTIAKTVSTPSVAWDYIKDLTPTFAATTGTVESSSTQNAKFTTFGDFAIAPISVCASTSFTAPISSCVNSSINVANTTTAAATSTVINYTWNFGDGSAPVVQTGSFTAPFPTNNPTVAPHTYSAAGIYTISLISTNDIACTHTAITTITVNALPTGTINPFNGTLSICPNSSQTLIANTSSSYTWGAIPSLTSAITTTLLLNQSGKYYFNMTDANGCSNVSDTLNVIVVPCTNAIGVSKSLISSDKETNGFLVKYRIKAVNYSNNAITNVNLTEKLSSTFPLPTTFSVQSLTLLYGSLVANSAFNGNSNSNLVVSPSNTISAKDSCILQLNVLVSPNNQTLFKNFVYVTATSTNGLISDTSCVGNNPDPNNDGIPNEISSTDVTLIEDLTIPGGFSPDGDNVNDLFVIKGIEAYPDNEIQIFNRWGNNVYTIKGYNSSTFWDGVSNSSMLLPGQKVPIGTYYYVIKLTPNDKAITGYITIKY